MLNDRSHPAIVEREASAVLVVDVQSGFRDHAEGFASMVREIRRLLEGARILGVPIARTEQYPKGLGATVPELVDAMGPHAACVEKLEFDATSAAGWEELPSEVRAARHVVVVGIEAHVCVRQTTLALLSASRAVHLPVDAVAARSALHRDVAVRSLARAGAHETTVEAVLLDWCGAAGSGEFRTVQALLKQP
ncbi:MAG: Isochorismatase family protein [Thermoleophilia bacterium]|nr:Isochorismatase family protein [Thermoleophilia bacterium]